MTDIIKFEDLKENFNRVLEQKNNKEYFLETELDKVKDLASLKASHMKQSGFFTLPHIQSSFKKYFNIQSYLEPKIFFEAFDSFMNEEEFNIERGYNELDEVFEKKQNTIKQAKEFAKYYNWLKTFQVKKNTKDKDSLSIAEKIIVLHFLKFDIKNIDNKTKASEILRLLFGEEGSQNISKKLSNIYAGKHKVFSEKNLKSIYQLFESKGFIEESNNIQKEIKKL